MTALDLAITELGDGSPVVILHGLFGRRRNWAQVQRDLATRQRVVAADLRNHGESPWSDSMTYEAMADDVAQLINVGPGPAIVIGHSMGGKAAMTLALTRPEIVRALAVIDIAPVTYDHDYDGYIRAMQSLPVADIERRSDADRYLAESIAEPGIRAFLLQNLAQTADGLVWQVNLDAIAAAMPAILSFPDFPDARYDGPTLFMRGEKSDYIRADHAATIERLFPDTTHTSIAGAGHWVHADKPGEVTAGLSEFMASLG